MSNEYTAGVATSRRAFIQRTGIAAVATAGAASVLLGSPESAFACTPIPPWLRPELYDKLIATFRPIEEMTKNYIVKLGGPNNQTLGLFAFRYFIDDYCGTFPKRPPIGPPPQFVGYERALPNFSNVQDAIGKFADGSVRYGIPSIIALSILRDDLHASLLLPAVQSGLDGPQADARVRLWRPWFPC